MLNLLTIPLNLSQGHGFTTNVLLNIKLEFFGTKWQKWTLVAIVQSCQNVIWTDYMVNHAQMIKWLNHAVSCSNGYNAYN